MLTKQNKTSPTNLSCYDDYDLKCFWINIITECNCSDTLAPRLNSHFGRCSPRIIVKRDEVRQAWIINRNRTTIGPICSKRELPVGFTLINQNNAFTGFEIACSIPYVSKTQFFANVIKVPRLSFATSVSYPVAPPTPKNSTPCDKIPFQDPKSSLELPFSA